MNCAPTQLRRLFAVNRRRRSRRAAGFTFVELMIVIVVIAIISAAAIPMFSGSDSAKLRAAADILVADIAYAQMESISHPDDPRCVWVQNGGTIYRVAPAATPRIPVIDPMTKQDYIVTYGSGRMAQLTGVTVSLTNAGDDSHIAFGPMGELDQTTPPIFTIRVNRSSLVVTVDPVTGEAAIASQITN